MQKEQVLKESGKDVSIPVIINFATKHYKITAEKYYLRILYDYCPDGGIGRRAGLKHQWQQCCAGSTPAPGTEIYNKCL